MHDSLKTGTLHGIFAEAALMGASRSKLYRSCFDLHNHSPLATNSFMISFAPA
jgi:hypothetical protein